MQGQEKRRWFGVVAVTVAVLMAVSAAAEGIRLASGEAVGWLRLLAQGAPPAFSEAPIDVNDSFSPGRSETRNDIWDTTSLGYLYEADALSDSDMSEQSTLPSTAPPILHGMDPGYEEVRADDSKESTIPHGPYAAPTLQGGLADPGAGLPLPWEAALPGGGSNSSETVVNSNTGNLNYKLSLFNWRAKWGGDVEFALYYNSRLDMTGVHQFGRGWRCNFDGYVYEPPIVGQHLDLIVRWGDGTPMPFHRPNEQTNTYSSPAGIHQTLTYVSAGQYKLTTKHGQTFLFVKSTGNNLAYLKEISERDTDNRIEITRGSDSRISEIKEGSLVRIRFDAGNRVLDFTQTGGNRIWTLDLAGGKLNGVSYPKLNPPNGPTDSRLFGYDSESGLIASETDLRGKVWTWAIPEGGMIYSFKTPEQDTSYFDQLPANFFIYGGQTTTFKTPWRSDYGTGFRSVVEHQYNNGRIANIKDEGGFSESFWWDSNRHVGAYTDKRRKIWWYEADTNGNVTQVTTPTGEVEKYSYSTNGFNELEKSWSEQVTPSTVKYTYGTTGRLTQINRKSHPTNPGLDAPILTAFASNTYGHYTSITPYGPGMSGSWSLLQFNLYNFPEQISDPQSSVTTLTYDEFGRITSLRAPGQTYADTIAYDRWGRPTVLTHTADGSDVVVQYDQEGNVLTVTDENDNTSSWSYDGDGQVLTFSNGKGETEHYSYDDTGFLKTVENGRGYQRQYVPNYRNEVYRLIHADGQNEHWSYNGNGEVGYYWNAYGTAEQTRTDYSFDDSGRPTGVAYTQEPAGVNTPDVTFSYSNYGRTVTMTDGTGTTSSTYDGFGRLTAFNQPNYAISYAYQSYFDPVTSMTDATGTTNYTYDAQGRLWKLTNPLGELTKWEYDGAGRLQKRTLGNNTTETIGYDNRQRVSTITLKNSAQAVLRHHVYGYDLASRVTGHTVDNVLTSYEYDDADQLTREYRGPTGNPTWEIEYDYDANGNRSARRVLNQPEETYANDAADKLLSITQNESVVRSFTYDLRGRRISDTTSAGTKTHSWDSESRLIGIGSNVTYAYNGLDSRVSKTAGSATTTYKRNGAYVTDPVLSEAKAGVTTTHTPGVSEKRGTSQSEYMHSSIKNADARTVTGSESTVPVSRQYDAFGNLMSSTGIWNGPFGYAGGFGYQEDAESGLKLLGHRYYDPTTGRFLSKDPAADGRNWYAYADSDPISLVDPNGLDGWWSHLLDGEVWGRGLATSVHALGHSLSLGFYDGGDYKDEPGFAESSVCWDVAGIAIGGAGAAKAAGKKVVEEGVYIVKTKSGKLYVGQSKHIEKRLKQHVRNGLVDLKDAKKAKRIKVSGGKRAREVREQKEINKRGGVRPRGKRLENQRNPVARGKWNNHGIESP